MLQFIFCIMFIWIIFGIINAVAIEVLVPNNTYFGVEAIIILGPVGTVLIALVALVWSFVFFCQRIARNIVTSFRGNQQ